MSGDRAPAAQPALADRLALLEAREAIQALKHHYAALCDSGYDGRAIAELFTEGGTWSSNVHGSIEGRGAIAAFMDDIGRERFPWAIHYIANPCIEVDVRAGRARGRWVLLQLASTPAEDRLDASALATGAYDDRLRLTADGWRFESVSLALSQLTDLRRGWPAAAVLAASEAG